MHFGVSESRALVSWLDKISDLVASQPIGAGNAINHGWFTGTMWGAGFVSWTHATQTQSDCTRQYRIQRLVCVRFCRAGGYIIIDIDHQRPEVFQCDWLRERMKSMYSTILTSNLILHRHANLSWYQCLTLGGADKIEYKTVPWHIYTQCRKKRCIPAVQSLILSTCHSRPTTSPFQR